MVQTWPKRTQRGLARPSEDGLSIPMHPEVRTTILVLLAQLARAAGRRHGIDLPPATSQPQPAEALIETLNCPAGAARGDGTTHSSIRSKSHGA